MAVGKTFTRKTNGTCNIMQGSEEIPGLTMKSFCELIPMVEEIGGSIAISCYRIYHDHIYDLLEHKEKKEDCGSRSPHRPPAVLTCGTQKGGEPNRVVGDGFGAGSLRLRAPAGFHACQRPTISVFGNLCIFFTTVMGIFHFFHRQVLRSFRGILFWYMLAVISQNATGENSNSTYLIGLGSYDITGPAADVNMMGYANMEQIASGIHFRLRARAFIVADPEGVRVVFVNLDACMASQIVTLKVIERLKSRYQGLYNEQNVAISGIHTHAGPGGYLQYVVYIVTSMGFIPQSFDVIVAGIEKAIIQAHENLRPGSLFVNRGELLDAGINRSPSAYLNNPPEERKKYKDDVDKEMTLIKFVDEGWGPIGSFNWFATHGTSMSRTNSLISGDNKGTAARLMEDWFQEIHGGTYVSEVLENSEENKFPRKLSAITSQIHAHYSLFKQLSVSFPATGGSQVDGFPDEFENTFIIGNRQFMKAVDLFTAATEKIKGKVDYHHTYLDLSNLEVAIPSIDGQKIGRTCPAAMGFAFAAGTTDGPGAFDFKQGDDKGNAFWKLVRNFLKTPSKEQVDCQHPKPILLDTGDMKEPYDWAPSVLPIQIIRIGQFVILCVPGEFSTMAGRRLREAVKTVLINSGNEEFDDNVHVVIAGLTNSYSQYVTTFEEYEIQRYEGASTLYGPHTLSAYLQEFKKLAAALVGGSSVPAGPQPPDLLEQQICLVPPVVVDSKPIGVKFGDVKSDVPQNSTFYKGEMVTVKFWSGCPRNDLLTEGTFALVEFLQGTDTWVPAYDDDDFCLRFKWSRPWKLSARSFATLEWRIPKNAASGVYRLRHFGAAKSLFGKISYFTGASSAFVVV
ncbi:hypothetical protein HPP92_012208 [Vanilla planifolia]|uniref:Neutral ceramidase n=1 Tax=Vanilla planifolia TaxID=51239 RepID=A0A835R8E4_VANPL|nr:hypothetical protein HPP92_012208 [Vanilla planifolia]